MQFFPRGKVVFGGVINAGRDTETNVHLVVHGKGVNNENRPSMRPIAYSSGSPWKVVEMRAKIFESATFVGTYEAPPPATSAG